MPDRPYKSTTHEENFAHIKLDTHPDLQAITVFVRKEDDGWYGSSARCVHGDQFCRRTGRQIARRRYFQWPDHRIFLGDVPPEYNFLILMFVEPDEGEEEAALPFGNFADAPPSLH